MVIKHKSTAINRNDKDYAKLYSSSWSGMLIGTDGYPTTNEYDHYCIAGGVGDYLFKAIAIEFYGEKTQILF